MRGTGFVTELTSSVNYTVYLYVYEGTTFNISKKKIEVKVNKVNKVVETDDTIMFFHFDNLVAMFHKENIIAYVAT